MEMQVVIKTKDKANIYGNLNIPKGKSKGLIVFVHGFTGNKDEHIFFNAAKYFTSKGYSTYRFDLYCNNKGARNFEDATIAQHGDDISDVVAFFSKDYKKLFLVGHSYGGTSLLFAKTDFVTGEVFWDAAYIDVVKERKGFDFNSELQAYVVDMGMRMVVGKKFVDEIFSFPNCGDLIKKILVPVCFIGAGKKGEGNAKDSKRYYKLANTPKHVEIIDNAGHGFITLDSEAELFEKTYSWIKSV